MVLSANTPNVDDMHEFSELMKLCNDGKVKEPQIIRSNGGMRLFYYIGNTHCSLRVKEAKRPRIIKTALTMFKLLKSLNLPNTVWLDVDNLKGATNVR